MYIMHEHACQALEPLSSCSISFSAIVLLRRPSLNSSHLAAHLLMLFASPKSSSDHRLRISFEEMSRVDDRQHPWDWLRYVAVTSRFLGTRTR